VFVPVMMHVSPSFDAVVSLRGRLLRWPGTCEIVHLAVAFAFCVEKSHLLVFSVNCFTNTFRAPNLTKFRFRNCFKKCVRKD